MLLVLVLLELQCHAPQPLYLSELQFQRQLLLVKQLQTLRIGLAVVAIIKLKDGANLLQRLL